jgi:protein-L-isoaspartate(D-aspartate) O-methyltransferase
MGATLVAGAALSVCACGRQRPESGHAGSAAREGEPRGEASAFTAPHPSAIPSAIPSSGPSQARAATFSERADERVALVRELTEQGISDPLVLRAMRTVPRHGFVLPGLSSMAYLDRPLPIVGGQTISQPYVVAFMTETAKPTARSKCLEIGTGSGYQAAVLAELCPRTFSIEYLPEVARFGEKNLRQLGYGEGRVALRVGDGYAGWPEEAPFDVIVVTAAPSRVPEPLLAQLAIGGRLVIPVGATDETQTLERWTRLRAGQDREAFRVEKLLPVRFVPFLGDHPAQ